MKSPVRSRPVLGASAALSLLLLLSSVALGQSPSDTDWPVTTGDFHRLQQVFVNVINNGHQAMVEANGRGRMVVRSERVGETIRVTMRPHDRYIKRGKYYLQYMAEFYNQDDVKKASWIATLILPKTKAEPKGDGSFVISGTKAFVPFGDSASHFLVTARNNGGVDAFIVARDAVGGGGFAAHGFSGPGVLIEKFRLDGAGANERNRNAGAAQF